MNFQVYRTSASSYQDSKFLANEKRKLEEVQGVTYIKSLQQYDGHSKLILITNTHTNFESFSDVILKNTVLILHPNSGYDNISEEFIDKAHFPIVIGNPIRANAVVEYSLSCIFHHYTQIPHHHHWHEDRTWKRKLLRDQKILILGHGHIGRTLAASLSPICPQLKVYDPFANPQHIPYLVQNEWDLKIFEDVSVLILAASLNPTSFEIINQQALNQLSSECLIINPARGQLINEQDLTHFIQKNPQTKAYLDVFNLEPYKPGHLDHFQSINKTSHIAGVYGKLNQDIISFEYLVVEDFVNRMNNNQVHQFTEEYADCILKNEVRA